MPQNWSGTSQREGEGEGEGRGNIIIMIIVIVKRGRRVVGLDWAGLSSDVQLGRGQQQQQKQKVYTVVLIHGTLTDSFCCKSLQ